MRYTLLFVLLSLYLLMPISMLAQTTNHTSKLNNTEETTKKKKHWQWHGMNWRVSTTFDNAISQHWSVGTGIHFNRSFFQFGFDGSISKNLTASDGIEETFRTEKNPITDKFRLNKETREAVADSPYDKSEKVSQEYIYSLGQLTVVPGLNFKYISLECAVGVSFNDCVQMNHLEIWEGNNMLPPTYSGTSKFTAYFVVRPTAVLYIPFSRKHNGLSISAGYDYVFGAEQALNGWNFGIGCFWSVP